MKKFYTIILFTIVHVNTNAQAPNWAWAQNFGLYTNDRGYNIATDASGNSYVTGSFSGPVTFGSFTLTSTNSTLDVFIAKYDASGNVLWAQKGGGDAIDEGHGICIDGNGNCYVIGYFTSITLAFGTTTLTNSNSGNREIFITKYNSAGNFVWAKMVSGPGDDFGLGIGVDGSGNSYVTGYFESTTITFGSFTLTNSMGGGYSDIFIAKYDSLGSAIWAKNPAGTDFDRSFAISTDAGGNSYITGFFESSVLVVGSNSLTNNSTGSRDFFIAKYDAMGNVVWAKMAGSYSDEVGYNIKCDASGNAYVVGAFKSSSVVFGTTTLNNIFSSTDDAFIVKYNPTGSPIWARRFGGSGDENCVGLAIDGTGNSFITGYYNSLSMTIGTTTLTNSNSSTPSRDIFVANYDGGGNPVWALTAGQNGTVENSVGIGIDNTGASYITGDFNSFTTQFGSFLLTNNNPNGSGADIFVAKLSSVTGILEKENTESLLTFPNPCTGIFFVDGKGELLIYDLTGMQIQLPRFISNRTEINLTELTKGIYFIQLKTEKEVFRSKIVIQ